MYRYIFVNNNHSFIILQYLNRYYELNIFLFLNTSLLSFRSFKQNQ